MNKNTDSKQVELSQESVTAFIDGLTVDQVREVYSGRQGCMCGCRGKYSVNPAHKAEADKERGYEQPATGRHLPQVRKVLALFQGNPRARIQDGNILYVADSRDEERNYVVYLCNSAAI
jgi:hypothetical protein